MDVFSFYNFNYDILLAGLIIFVPLERLLPLRPAQKVLRKNWITDVMYVALNGIFIKIGFIFTILLAVLIARSWVPTSFQAALSGQPLWLQFMEAIVIGDLGIYFMHRMFHSVPFLWRIHQIHHSIEEMDWMVAFHIHPLDQILTKGVSNGLLLILGFSPEAVIAYAILFKWQTILVHCNTRINFGPLRLLIASPEFHHWHHSGSRVDYDKNFSAMLPVIDALFGTFHMPKGGAPEKYGIKKKIPENYVRQLLHPFF